MWFKSPKSSTFNTQVYPTGVAVLAMTHTTVTYTTIGVEGLEPYEMDQQKIWHPGNDDVALLIPRSCKSKLIDV